MLFTNEHDLVIATLQKQTKTGIDWWKLSSVSLTSKLQQYMFAAIGIQVSFSENLFQDNIAWKNDLLKKLKRI